MSGFAGILHLNQAPIEEHALSRLCQAARRGELAGETMQRLGEAQTGCVATLSSGVHGPTGTIAQSGQVWALCDGRLDNWDELKPLCEAAGFASKSPNAAQGVLAAYAKWGLECPQHLLGDYVFVAWDERTGQLLCARDPAQSKSLYYVFDGRSFRWASDPRALLCEPDVSRDYDAEYLTTYMVMSSLNWERTPYEAIKQLPGGHALVVEKGVLSTWQWWQLPEPGSLRYKRLDDYHEHLHSLMHDAVRVRLRSDAPVHIALSRGIDSAAIAASTANLIQSGQAECPDVRCVTFALPANPEADENPDARIIADHLKLPHHTVEPWALRDEYAQQVGRLKEPNGVSNHWNLWDPVRQLCEENGSRVLLTGTGGELFESPDFYLGDLMRSRQIIFLLRELWRWREAGTPLSRAVRIGLRGLQEPPYHWEPRQKLKHYPWLRFPERCHSEFHSLTLSHPVVRENYHFFVEKGQAIPGLRPLFDPAGIEIRCPLLDRRLVEFAYSLPIERKLLTQNADGTLMNKPVLRKAFVRELPPSLTKPNGRLRKYAGESFSRYVRRVQELLTHPPEALRDVVDLEVLREHMSQLLQDRGSKRYVALTSHLTCWLAYSAQDK